MDQKTQIDDIREEDIAPFRRHLVIKFPDLKDDHDDIVVEWIVKLLKGKKMGCFDEGPAGKSYLYKTLRSCAVDFVRKRGKVIVSSELSDACEGDAGPDITDERYERKDVLIDWVRDFVTRCTDGQRFSLIDKEIIERSVRGEKPQAIGEAMSVKCPQINECKRRFKEWLKRKVDGHELEEFLRTFAGETPRNASGKGKIDVFHQLRWTAYESDVWCPTDAELLASLDARPDLAYHVHHATVHEPIYGNVSKERRGCKQCGKRLKRGLKRKQLC